MDASALKARLAQVAAPLDAVPFSGAMTPADRERAASVLDGVAREADRDLRQQVRAQTDADLRDDVARLYRRLAQSNSWLEGRDDRTREWIDAAADLAASDVLKDLVTSDQNGLRDSESLPEIRMLCQQGLVDKARRLAVARRKATKDPVARRRLDELLAEPRNFLGPMKSAPSMVTMNGFGTMLWGSRAAKPDGSYITTLCIVFVFMPLIPLRSYLAMQESGNRYRFFGVVPLSPFAFWWRRLVLTAPIVLTLGIWGLNTIQSSPMLREGRLLASASEKLAQGNQPGALDSLAEMLATNDAGRGARMDEIARSAISTALAQVRDARTLEFFLNGTGRRALQQRPQWGDGAVLDAADAAIVRSLPSPKAGPAVRHCLDWMRDLAPAAAARIAATALKACAACDDPRLLAAALDLHARAKLPCPADIAPRLKTHLLATHHEGWEEDAGTYLGAADPAEAQPVLLARLKHAWVHERPGDDLLRLKDLPAPLKTLIDIDHERDPQRRATAIEKAADPGDLPEPQRTWHRLGAARRFVEAWEQLTQGDPVRFPAARMKPWVIQAAELAPADDAMRVKALRCLIEEGEFARAIALGSSTLGDSRTAVLVGIAQSRSGAPEAAAKILRPIVQEDLEKFADAVERWQKAVNDRTAAAWETLQNGTADQSVIRRLNSLPKERAAVEAETWVRQQIEHFPDVAQPAREWRERIDVQAAAGELAMVELSLARDAAPGPARQTRLEAAEKIFVTLRRVDRDDPSKEIQLANVYVWLGKEKEAAEIFTRTEASGDPEVLAALGQLYRTLGRMQDSRRILELAYEKTSGSARHALAAARAQASDSMEDRVAWLEKADPSQALIAIELNQARAELALQRGAFAEAVEPLRATAEYFAGLPETAASQNNAALAKTSLARATGDFTFEVEALRFMRRAHELVPENAIVASNYLDLVEDVGAAALCKDALRPDLLHSMPNAGWIEYLDPPIPAADLAARAKAQPELRRAAELAAKLTVLSPDRAAGYNGQAHWFSITRDAASLRKLRESVEARPPARAEQETRTRAHAKGEYSAEERKEAEKMAGLWASLLPAIRKGGHAPTLAYALTADAYARFGSIHMGVTEAGFEEAVKEVEEASSAFDARVTRRSLAWIRQEQAHRALAATDPDFAAWRKDQPSLSVGTLLPLYARIHPERAAAIRAAEGMKRAADAIAACKRFPEGLAWLGACLWLDLAGHPEAAMAKAQVRADPMLLDTWLMGRALNPANPEDVATAWLAALAYGDAALADRIAAGAKAAGVLPAVFGR